MIGACCPALEMLDITGCDAVADVGLVQLAVSCPLLKRLFLSESNDTEAGRARVKVKELCPRIMVEYFGVGERQVGADDREVTITEAMDGSDELVVQFSGGDTGVYDKSSPRRRAAEQQGRHGHRPLRAVRRNGRDRPRLDGRQPSMPPRASISRPHVLLEMRSGQIACTDIVNQSPSWMSRRTL